MTPEQIKIQKIMSNDPRGPHERVMNAFGGWIGIGGGGRPNILDALLYPWSDISMVVSTCERWYEQSRASLGDANGTVGKRRYG